MKALVFGLILTASATIAQDTVVTPPVSNAPRWTVRTQFAGFQGTGSALGLWNARNGKFQAGLGYGYSPKGDGDLPFHAALARISWTPIPYQRTNRDGLGQWSFSPALSMIGLVELGGISFLSIPSQYYDGYYGPMSPHALFAFGGRATRRFGGRLLALSAEIVGLDTYVWYSLKERTIPISYAWSWSLGLEFYFGERSDP